MTQCSVHRVPLALLRGQMVEVEWEPGGREEAAVMAQDQVGL